MSRPFQIVDVFSDTSFGGNPVAVVLDGHSLDSDDMLRITRWLNLSETTFVLPPSTPDADYRVRIFTLERELPFAGHPTLGTAHAWLRAGGVPRGAQVVQECMAGLIHLRRSDDRLSFAAPPLLRTGPLSTEKLDEIAGVIGAPRSAIVDAAWCDNGPGWAGVLLASAEDVLALEPARSHPTRLEIGVVGPCAPGSSEAFEIRAFFSDQHGVLREDPVTGSLNAAVAQWLVGSGRATPPYVTRQGTCLGRDGRVHISGNSQQLWVGGVTATQVEGELFASD